MPKTKTGVRRYDSRVRLWKPAVPILNEDNPFNEKDKDYVVAFESYPANRLDSLTENDEKSTSNVVKSISEVEWELAYSPNLGLRASWKIEDLSDNQFYQVSSPMTKEGRGLGYRVITNIVQ